MPSSAFEEDFISGLLLGFLQHRYIAKGCFENSASRVDSHSRKRGIPGKKLRAGTDKSARLRAWEKRDINKPADVPACTPLWRYSSRSKRRTVCIPTRSTATVPSTFGL